MFERMTYENILSGMLEKVISDVDKREGSIIYDALAPCAIELAQSYLEMSNYIDLIFLDTSKGEYLDRKVSDFNLVRKKATKSIRKILTDKEVVIGSRWAIEDTTYAIISLIEIGQYKAECEQYGDIGNAYKGALQSLDNTSDALALLSDILISGQDDETDYNLRSRFYNKVQRPATSGNAYHYRQWALEVEGVGDCKVFPLYNGPGTVQILIVDSDKSIDSTLESKVDAYIETVRPIGATVAVTSPTAKAISATATIALNGLKTLLEVKSLFESRLKTYLNDTVFKTYSISYAMIGSLLLTTEGVADYTNLKLNNGTANLTISNTEIPILGTVTFS